jgi:hypothetical protein
VLRIAKAEADICDEFPLDTGCQRPIAKRLKTGSRGYIVDFTAKHRVNRVRLLRLGLRGKISSEYYCSETQKHATHRAITQLRSNAL